MNFLRLKGNGKYTVMQKCDLFILTLIIISN